MQTVCASQNIEGENPHRNILCFRKKCRWKSTRKQESVLKYAVLILCISGKLFVLPKKIVGENPHGNRSRREKPWNTLQADRLCQEGGWWVSKNFLDTKFDTNLETNFQITNRSLHPSCKLKSLYTTVKMFFFQIDDSTKVLSWMDRHLERTGGGVAEAASTPPP